MTLLLFAQKIQFSVISEFQFWGGEKMCCFSTKLTGSTLEFILLFILCKTFVFELVGDLKNQIRLILNDDLMIDK